MVETIVPNPVISMICFLIMTSIYVVLKYKNVTSDKDSNTKASNNKMYWLGYFLAIILVQFGINLGLTNALCGDVQYIVAFKGTIIPWTILFGSLCLILNTLPSWKNPFSNTIGYGITYLSGLNTTINENLDPKKFDKENLKRSGISCDSIAILRKLYSNPSKIINKLTIDGTNEFWNPLIEGLYDNKNRDEFIKTMKNFIHRKDIVAEFIWYMLTGGLIVTISYNYIVNYKCSKSSDKVKKTLKLFEETQKENKANKNISNQKFITTE